MTTAQRCFSITDSSQVGAARRHAQHLAESAAGASSNASSVASTVALIATELANNLVRHAAEGRLFVQLVRRGAGCDIELLSVDRGPGMSDVSACMRDGYSSGGTAGTGLGAIRRLATTFDVHSEPGKGTVVLARIEVRTPEITVAWRWGTVTTPAPGETVIGDSWRIAVQGDQIGVLVADGLGHGPLASEAAEGAARLFESTERLALRPFFDRAHSSLRPTRGAALAVALCSTTSDKLTFAGVGNIAGMILRRDGALRGLMSHNGTVGAEMRLVQELSYDWEIGDRLIMHSDGLRGRWSVADYDRLMRCHPAVIGAVLHRDHLRGRDDATIVVMERAA